MMPSRTPGTTANIPSNPDRNLRLRLAALACALLAASAVAAQTDGAQVATPPDSTAPAAADSVPLTDEEKIAQLNARILQEPRNGDLYNNLGVIYAQQQNWPLAREAFLKAVQSKPTDADFHRNLALVLVRLKEYDMAVMEFQAYQRFDIDGGPDADRLIGNAWRDGGNDDKAVAAYRAGLEARKNDMNVEGLRLILALAGLFTDEDKSADARSVMVKNLPAVQRLGSELSEEGDEEGAQLADAIENNLVASYIEDGKLLEESGLPLDAVPLYEKAFELDPSQDALLVRITDAYLAADQTASAAATAKLAREKHPGSSGTWIATGKVAEREGRLKDAVDAYLKARGIGPASPDLDLVIGNLYMKLGDSARARQYMAKGADDPDAPPEVVYNYAVSLLRQKQYGRAADQLMRVTKEAPDMPQGWQALGHALRGAKRYGEAVEAYRKALEFGDDAKLRFNLGYCYARLGRTDDAIAAYRQAIALEPGFIEAHYNLGRTLLNAGRYEQAIAAMEEHLKYEPHSYRIYLNEGLCYYKLDRYQEAIDKYELALEQKETADAYNNMGLAYAKLGDKEKANACYRDAKKLKGGS